METKQYPASSLETAACLWEAVLEMMLVGESVPSDPEQEQRGQMIRAARERIGTSGLRLFVLRWVDLVDAEWAKVRDSYDSPFDWEFVPDWIAQNIDWSGDHPTYKLGGRP